MTFLFFHLSSCAHRSHHRHRVVRLRRLRPCAAYRACGCVLTNCVACAVCARCGFVCAGPVAGSRSQAPAVSRSSSKRAHSVMRQCSASKHKERLSHHSVTHVSEKRRLSFLFSHVTRRHRRVAPSNHFRGQMASGFHIILAKHTDGQAHRIR
jgi:hypothetical protein